MANNRMWLIHKGTKKKILLAKYIPMGEHGWCLYPSDLELDAFFDEVQAVASGFDYLWGPIDFELVFEQLPEGPNQDERI